MDSKEKEIILALASGPKTMHWMRLLGLSSQPVFDLIDAGFVECRGVEYLYPFTDRVTGARQPKVEDEIRFKGWSAVWNYYGLTLEGYVLVPPNRLKMGVVK